MKQHLYGDAIYTASNNTQQANRFIRRMFNGAWHVFTYIPRAIIGFTLFLGNNLFLTMLVSYVAAHTIML